MNKIKMTSYLLVLLIFGIFSIGTQAVTAPSLIIGTIQFSKDSTVVPININCGGAQIPTSLHTTINSKITFEIPKSSDQYHFDVLVTQEKIEFEPKRYPNGDPVPNTVDYLTINPNSSYLFYEFEFINNGWIITKKGVPGNGRIPDKTIIIECYSEWVDHFEGGSIVELPTLFLNNNITGLSQTENDFKEALIKLELTALDSKIINAPTKQQIVTLADKKLTLII